MEKLEIGKDHDRVVVNQYEYFCFIILSIYMTIPLYAHFTIAKRYALQAQIFLLSGQCIRVKHHYILLLQKVQELVAANIRESERSYFVLVSIGEETIKEAYYFIRKLFHFCSSVFCAGYFTILLLPSTYDMTSSTRHMGNSYSLPLLISEELC